MRRGVEMGRGRERRTRENGGSDLSEWRLRNGRLLKDESDLVRNRQHYILFERQQMFFFV